MIGSLAWTSVDRFGQQFIQFFITIVLARLLTPDEYTLIALVTIFVTLSNTLTDGGFGFALVRKQDATDLEFSTVFYFNVFVSVFLYLLLYFLAVPIAAFYKQPDLVLVARVVFLSILFNSFYLIPNVKLVKNLDFGSSAKVNILSVFLSGVTGIAVALYGLGVWALVAQQVTFQMFRVIVIHYFVKWKPVRGFSFQIIRNFWSYSIGLLGTSVLNNIFNYLYLLVLGKYFKQELGLYYQANKLNETTNFSFQVILGSTYSVFVKIQDDTERFVRVFRELVRRSSIVIIPGMLLLIVIAHPLIYTLLSAKWLPSVPYFQMLALASIFNPFYALSIGALNARGKSKATFTIEFVKKALILLSVFVCIDFGVIALLAGFCVANYLSFIITVFAIKKELKHYWRHQFSDIFYAILIGVIVGGIALLLTLIIENLYVLLLAQVLTGLVVYVASIRLFYKEIFNSVYSILKEKIQKWQLKIKKQ
ncbi:MAG: polysaccharide biosynthesis protein [Bacteroidetes bacterium]|nr:polysaccharide biosynthesis protein [Bacteroidota bacterium]